VEYRGEDKEEKKRKRKKRKLEELESEFSNFRLWCISRRGLPQLQMKKKWQKGRRKGKGTEIGQSNKVPWVGFVTPRILITRIVDPAKLEKKKKKKIRYMELEDAVGSPQGRS